MLDLMKMQDRFQKALYGQTDDLTFIASKQQLARLNIYRNNIIEALVGSLSISFPGVWKLLGDRCASSLARIFCADLSNLPKTGYLGTWGDAFPHFLGNHPILADLPYIEDYAYYEWYKQLSYIAQDGVALSIEVLAPDKFSKIQLSFIPSLYLYKSRYPISSIQKIIDEPNAEPINITNCNEYLLIARPQLKVLTYAIEGNLYNVIKGLTTGYTLDKALCPRDEINIKQLMEFIFQNHLVAGIKQC
jgi:hypothetical protein